MDTAPFTLENTTDAPAVFHAPPCSGSLDLRLGDCMEGMKTFPDGYFDLAVVDPPYGINWLDQVKNPNKGKNWKVHEYKPWDQSPRLAESNHLGRKLHDGKPEIDAVLGDLGQDARVQRCRL